MKKTVTKVLLALLAAAMMIGAAAGCNNNGSGSGSDNKETVSSAVESKEESKQNSLTPIEGSGDNAKFVDLRSIEKDKIELALTGKDDEGKYEELFIAVDDGTENGYAAIFISETQNGKKLFSGAIQGSVTAKGEPVTENGATTRQFVINDLNGMTVDVTLVSNDEKGEYTMTFSDNPYVMHLEQIGSTDEVMKAVDEALTSVETNSYSADAAASSDAATVDTACKGYYTELVAGVLDEKFADNIKSDTLPDANETDSKKRTEAAMKCTIGGALEYYGLKDSISEDALSKMVADEYGTIKAQHELDAPTFTNLSTEMTLGELYGKNIAVNEDSKTQASIIDNACKTYYASVAAGLTNTDDEWSKNVKSDKLPDENATEEERIQAAFNCTIQGALEYNGLADAEFDWALYGADKKGTIIALSDENAVAVVESVSPTTTFKDLGYDKMITEEDASAESVEE